MKGVDISNYQAGLDLADAKSGGIEFAICKISEGRSYRDRQFDTFYEQARSCGLPIGAYVYSHAITPDAAIAEANLAILLLDGRPLQLGIWLDVETSAQMEIPRAQLAETLRAFCETVEAAGYRSGLYGSEYNLWTRITAESFPRSLIWIAHYGKHPEIPCDIWQRTDKGSFPGYTGPVDTDEVMSERMTDIIRGGGENPQPEPSPEPQPEPEPEGELTVMVLQLLMKRDGYWDGPIDGIRTPKWRAAFREWSADVAGC